MSNSNDNTMDVQIGQRIKRARLEAAITQQELGSLLGRSSQQIHKYEQGTNRVSAGTLYTIARALDRSLDWFFSGVEPGWTVVRMMDPRSTIRPGHISRPVRHRKSPEPTCEFSPHIRYSQAISSDASADPGG